MSGLFSPFSLKDVTLRNRIAVPPMCQYTATDGLSNEWHRVHYSGLEKLAQIARDIKAAGAVPGIQIAHAGRKASANRPWEGDDHIAADDGRGWETIAPSAVAFGANLPQVPKAMTLDDIARVREDFATAARRARDAGFEWLELHFAHGYLAQSFFSVQANQRQDQYGGDLAGRSRFMLETLEAVRHVWPENLPLTARFGVIEYDGRDEETLAESIEVTRQMRANGLDLLSVSIGFSTPDANIPWGPAFLAPIAERVRREAQIPVASAWGIDAPAIANRTVEEQQLDLVMVGRAHLANPHWPYQAALALKEEKAAWVLPAPYAHWLERYRTSE
ncbi:MAG: NADH:flavin oxidoreductase/NADH oxidase [Pantoea sp.]|nr:NADH:flavin oxidoreductase/NADH oxidase [Pantoea sp.]